MLRRPLVLALASLILWCGAHTLYATVAAADDDGQTAVTSVNGEVEGALTVRRPGNNRKVTKPKLPASKAPPSSPSPSTVVCDGVRTVSRPVTCTDPTTPHAWVGFTPPSEAEVRVALHLPDPAPHFGPDPDNNEWKMLVVGYPIWLWTDPPTHLTTTATHDGLTMTLAADLTSTTFDTGDGHQTTCTHTTKYPAHPDHYATPSPTCGHTYTTRSQPGHDYTVTATTRWTVTWTTGGHAGTLTTDYTGQHALPIGELQALIKG